MSARTAPPTAAPADPPATAGSPAWGGVDGFAFAREAMSAWACGCTAWTDYLRRVTTSTEPLAIFDAGIQLMADSLEICSQAAAAPLKATGIKAPLLNDR